MKIKGADKMILSSCARTLKFSLAVSFMVLIIGEGCERRSEEKKIFNPVFSTVEEVILMHPEYSPETLPENPPNVIVLLIDALRADHLSCYGYPRSTSPFIDQMAREGTLFSNAFVHSSHTLPSTACLFTGAIPPVNGFHRYGIRDSDGRIKSDLLLEDNVTMAELFKQNGYHTGAFVSNGVVGVKTGFNQGFDFFFNETEQKGVQDTETAVINQQALAWMKDHNDRPFFCYVHYMDVHVPYHPPNPYKFYYSPVKGRRYYAYNEKRPTHKVKPQDLAFTVSQYDGEINCLDNLIRHFFINLRESGLLENTLVIVTADHGDEFMEHGGFAHGTTLYDELLHVPLVFWYLGVIPAGVVRHEMVMQTDLYPTLASFAKAPVEGLPLYGVNLFPRPSQKNPKTSSERFLYAEIFGEVDKVQLKAIRSCSAKLILIDENGNTKPVEYYDLVRDPKEQNNLFNPDDPSVMALMDDLESITETSAATPNQQVILKEKQIETLKSLGYLE